MVVIVQELPADAQDHRPVPAHERGERRLTGGIAPRGEPLDELTIGQASDGGPIEKRFDLPRDR